MTRLALIADVHADVHALEDALRQIERLGCDAIVCAGDLLDWGLFPEETVRVIRERAIPCIRGNHERWAVRDGVDMSGWDLTPAAITFLEKLPATWSRTLDGVRVLVTHARPGSDMAGVYPDARLRELQRIAELASADVFVAGHTHIPMVLTVTVAGSASAVFVNPGAILRDPAQPMTEGAMLYDPEAGAFAPAPTSTGGTFAVLELPSREVRFYRAADGVEVTMVMRRWVT